VNALQAFIKTEDGANLLAAYKRAANILKKEDWKGAEGEIARTGEEDPLALVDDPDLKPVIEAKLAEKKKKQLSYTPEPAEKELIEALDSAEPKAAAAVQAEDFEAAMAALASLRGPIDRFFDSVTVNDSDAAKRSARLDLLGRFRSAVHQVADFSKIEG
jgi:glycyl-tRNA synthetase beta chain